ncbi:MAG: type II toxin-antitoxin system VapC family toxin [Acidobacteria bacterium]|nr:type II toxin-antitoxin system VapC family toxin [Acidobacteriota bacterium]
MIFVDSNVPMYLVGSPHPHKLDAQRLLERAVADGQKLVTSAEVFQEILHRYTALGRRDAIQPAWDVLAAITDEVFAIALADVDRARAIVLERRTLSARDGLHAAVMQGHGVSGIMSFDQGFDNLPGISRIE